MTRRKIKDKRLITLALLLRELRIKTGYSSAELFCYENDINRTVYWRWENGENITMAKIFKLCDIHGISPGDFFNRFENLNKEKGDEKKK